MDTYVVKVGTDTITQGTHLNGEVMASNARQISELGQRVILVSSGAIGAAKTLLPPNAEPQIREMDQGLSCIGQWKLMAAWDYHFNNHNIGCGQILLKEEDFNNGKGRENLCRTLDQVQAIEQATGKRFVLIVNGNDVTSHGPIEYDNDHIAGIVTEVSDATKLIIETDVDGLFNGDPHDSASRIIREVRAGVDEWRKFISPNGSKNGKGNMDSKCEVAERLARLGKEALIGNGKEVDAIHRLIRHEIGTRFYS
ncbi:MAG: hypothetical protein QF755_00190 [Candidatus Peribacteraceae bacterium]|jgi:glutamate 5-kinase|nr:hypothetical protein [Candidatus Peribacteraceae bacterium]|tara:strand:+ start:474 stop:1235 length:762 start_codon:yes stop_codon:yes gene_type:complete